MSEIGDALRGARAYLTEHPDEARYRDSAATARLDRGLAVTVDGPDGAVLRTDMPPSIGGGGAAPSPGWYLRAAHAACVATLVAMRAAEEGVALDRLEVVVDSESDDRGITGARDAVPAGPLLDAGAHLARVGRRGRGRDSRDRRVGLAPLPGRRRRAPRGARFGRGRRRQLAPGKLHELAEGVRQAHLLGRAGANAQERRLGDDDGDASRS